MFVDPVRSRNEIVLLRIGFPRAAPAVVRKFLGRNSMRRIFGIALAAGALMLTACNTVEGVGKDVSSAGDTVAKTADKNK